MAIAGVYVIPQPQTNVIPRSGATKNLGWGGPALPQIPPYGRNDRV